jgi:branched-chain amino acid aminotransferase
MLTAEGHVSEGSAENIFLFINNELVTPPPSENILLGVTRDTVIQLARRELDRITRERVIDRTELYVADEILLTGTGAQICPVVEVDHRPIGTGVIGPIGQEIQRLYGEVVRGKRAEYMEWCTPVFGDTSRPVKTAAHNGHHIERHGHNGSAAPGRTAGRKSATNGRGGARKAGKTDVIQA